MRVPTTNANPYYMPMLAISIAPKPKDSTPITPIVLVACVDGASEVFFNAATGAVLGVDDGSFGHDPPPYFPPPLAGAVYTGCFPPFFAACVTYGTGVPRGLALHVIELAGRPYLFGISLVLVIE